MARFVASVFKFCLHLSDNLSIASVLLLQWYVILKENNRKYVNFPDLTDQVYVEWTAEYLRFKKKNIKNKKNQDSSLKIDVFSFFKLSTKIPSN